MRRLQHIFFVSFLLITSLVSAQSVVSGKVFSADQKAALPFVNIIVPGTTAGTLSDIDGKFMLRLPSGSTKIWVSYLGYESKEYPINASSDTLRLMVYLTPKRMQLKEVKILAGENPAHRIIREVSRNRKKNDPKQGLNTYSYVSYNKFTILMDTSSIHLDSVFSRNKKDSLGNPKIDSDKVELRDFIRARHFFLTESVTDVRFKNGLENEKILASRISGFQNPIFALIAAQLQSFSFYPDEIAIASEKYLNPLSTGSTSRYFFNLEDTLYINQDTVYIVSFKPRKNTNFKGMKGQLFINTDGYAIQSVIAEPADTTKNGFKIKIQQRYEKVGRQAWFPTQLNTDLIFGNNVKASDGTDQMQLLGVGRSYLREIQINPELRRRDLGINGTEYAEGIGRRDIEFWSQYRVDSLSLQENGTYHFMDSVGKKIKLDQKVTFFLALLSGRVPIGKVDIQLNQLLRFNNLEGFRTGLGIITNDKFSKWVYGSGYFAYGFKDQVLKYGGEAGVNLNRSRSLGLFYRYTNDVFELGEYSFLQPQMSLTSPDNLRTIFLRWFDYAQTHTLGLRLSNVDYLSSELTLRWSENAPLSYNGYRFMNPNDGTLIPQQITQYQEVGLKMRYAYRERYLKTPSMTVSMGTDKPIFQVNFMQGISNGSSASITPYQRVEARVSYELPLRHAGKIAMRLTGGWASDNTPISRLYFLQSTEERQFSIFAPTLFQTFGPNQFLANQFVHLNAEYDFGKFLPKNTWVNPRLMFTINSAYGQLRRPESHINFPVQYSDFKDGLHEGGVFLNDIFQKTALKGYGMGFIYRMGAYSMPNATDNLYFRLTFKQIL